MQSIFCVYILNKISLLLPHNKSIFNLFDIFISFLGVIALIVICAYVVVKLPGKIEQFMRKQNKIKCLCKHEYIKDYTFTMGPRTDYYLVCRKCGKKAKITIYDDEV